MLHIVPILCLIAFIWVLEIRLKRELHEIEQAFRTLKYQIEHNRSLIDRNRDDIAINKENIDKLNG